MHHSSQHREIYLPYNLTFVSAAGTRRNCFNSQHPTSRPIVSSPPTFRTRCGLFTLSHFRGRHEGRRRPRRGGEGLVAPTALGASGRAP